MAKPRTSHEHQTNPQLKASQAEQEAQVRATDPRVKAVARSSQHKSR